MILENKKCSVGCLTVAVGLLVCLASVRADEERVHLTKYPNLASLCWKFARRINSSGHIEEEQPPDGMTSCKDHDPPQAVISVTHENDKNTHFGSLNYRPDVKSYMHDFNLTSDFGRWFDFKVADKPADLAFELRLDTVDHNEVNVTGWNLRFGHLFIGFNDLSVRAALDKSVFFDFDLMAPRLEIHPELNPGGYSGYRILVGAALLWSEASPRQNRSHFFEIDLAQSPGYPASFNEPRFPLCRDRNYDRCFYSNQGSGPEGRFVSYSSVMHSSSLTGSLGWVHVHLPLSDLVKSLRWVSPPADWSSAILAGVYIGIESQGASRSSIRVKHYDVYTEKE